MKRSRRIVVILIKLVHLVALITLVRCFGPQGAEHIRASVVMLATRVKSGCQSLPAICRAILTFLFKRKGELT